jgi:hypothetical protein
MMITKKKNEKEKKENYKKKEAEGREELMNYIKIQDLNLHQFCLF